MRKITDAHKIKNKKIGSLDYHSIENDQIQEKNESISKWFFDI